MLRLNEAANKAETTSSPQHLILPANGPSGSLNNESKGRSLPTAGRLIVNKTNNLPDIKSWKKTKTWPLVFTCEAGGGWLKKVCYKGQR